MNWRKLCLTTPVRRDFLEHIFQCDVLQPGNTKFPYIAILSEIIKNSTILIVTSCFNRINNNERLSLLDIECRSLLWIGLSKTLASRSLCVNEHTITRMFSVICYLLASFLQFLRWIPIILKSSLTLTLWTTVPN